MATTNRDLGLGSIRVDKHELIEKLRANRVKHVQDYTEAYAGYLGDSITKLKKALREAKKGNIQNVNFRAPECHEKDYTLVIEMLEMSVDDHIDLSAHEFKQYVRDEWAWSDTFNNTKMLYSGK